VRGVRHVGADTSVGTVCSATSSGGAVALDVGNFKVISGEALGAGIGLGILEHIKNDLSRLDGPAAVVSGGLVLASLPGSSNSSVEPVECHALLHLNDILKVLFRPLDLLVLNHLADVTAVLEVHAKVGPSGLADLGLIIGLSRVAGHFIGKGGRVWGLINCRGGVGWGGGVSEMRV